MAPKKLTKVILKHELVPKHEIAKPEEVAEILRKYGIKPEQLPWIKASDPIIRAIGAKPGDVIKITRKSPTAGEVIVYRYVVPG
ncbi:MAG: DNA-directed RNA polymerase subunit H [Thermoprotei archaeon]|nr:MAG: DNA-directed RNA polymerase subunit H [Thermoprotei archaeon]